MDLETENRLAALLMEEARRLRQQADKEGVHVYLRQPKVRGRPNSRFLTATVLGVQQANRAVEISEMWRAREKELELENKLTSRSKDKMRHRGERDHGDPSKVGSSSRHMAPKNSYSSSSSIDEHKHVFSEEDDGLRDEEVDEFLHLRVKRGRGAIGSRMDEPGPYPTSSSLDHEKPLLVDPETRTQEEWERRVLGPEKPLFLRAREESEDEDVRETKKVKKYESSSLKKHKQRELKEKRRSKEEKSRKKKKERGSKHHHKSR